MGINIQINSDNLKVIGHVDKYVENDYAGNWYDMQELADADFEVMDEEDNEVGDVNTELSTSRKGRPKEYLFVDAKGNKDEVVTAQQAKIFVAFLKKHNRYSKKIDSKSATYFNQSIIAFYRMWEEENLVPRKSPKSSALTRFIVEDCGIKISVDQRTYSSFIGKALGSDYKLDYEIESDVNEFVKEYKLQ